VLTAAKLRNKNEQERSDMFKDEYGEWRERKREKRREMLQPDNSVD